MAVLDEFINAGFVVHDAVEMPPAVEPPTIHAVGAGELAGKTFAPLVEPVKGLIVEGLTLLCGASKIGKSWFVLQMCTAVATGTPFLGRTTVPGSVLYLALEDGERRLKARLRRQNSAPGDNLQFQTEIITLDGGLLNALDGWILQNPGAKLVVIDTLQMIRGVIPNRANAYAADVTFMKQLKGFADAHHIAIVAVHHLNKVKAKDVADPFERISGSNGLMATADSTLLITRQRGEDDATVTYTGRDVWGDDFQIRFDDCCWRVCDPALLARERYERTPIVQAVKRFVEQGAFDGLHSASYEDFRCWAADSCGLFVGVNQRETKQLLERYAAQMAQYDGIHISLEKRTGTRRGFTVATGGGDR